MTGPSLFGGKSRAQPAMGGNVPLVNLLEHYRRAGCYERLCLWIRYRGLRPYLKERHDEF